MTGALLLSMAIALLIGPKLIAYLKKLHFGQTIYELGLFRLEDRIQLFLF